MMTTSDLRSQRHVALFGSPDPSVGRYRPARRRVRPTPRRNSLTVDPTPVTTSSAAPTTVSKDVRSNQPHEVGGNNASRLPMFAADVAVHCHIGARRHLPKKSVRFSGDFRRGTRGLQRSKSALTFGSWRCMVPRGGRAAARPARHRVSPQPAATRWCGHSSRRAGPR